MAPRREEDYSDSDEEPPSGVETGVLLGIPDGPVTTVGDIRDAAVSRIGGYPAFLPFDEPSIASSRCQNCSNLMELLVQMWCPFQDSPMDRALYVWGCARRGCQRQKGSVRAWRGLRFNAEYAAQLAKKKGHKSEKREKEIASKLNPFSMSPAQSSPHSLIFGDKLDMDNGPHDTQSQPDSSSNNLELVTAIASVTIEDSAWVSAPSYPAIYLSTTTEYLPPLPASNLPLNVRIQDSAKGNDTHLAIENYENSLRIDRIFDTFSRRVSYQGEQCVRYELNGKPLPFASDKVYDQLFPLPTSPTPLPVTKAAFTVVPPLIRTYQPSSLPACPSCGSRRVFECQLMPNSINVLAQAKKGTLKKPMTDEERMKEVRDTLHGGNNTDEKAEMEWGTCMIFSCEKDCTGDEARECWKEEIVLVQWDT